MATLKFVQAQKFSLAGSGASIGDTTITLQSMVGIDGDLITTTDIGVKGFGTLEPGNGTQEESITFTGITQNSNGTATLTGVKSALFVSPYTETSGLSKTHAGATTFILSNEAAFYGAILDYVDNALISGGIPATNLVQGITKLSVAAVSGANPIAVGDNDPRLPTSAQSTYLSQVSDKVGITNFVFGETISAGQPVYFRNSDGRVYLTNGGASSTAYNYVGIAYESGIVGQTKKVQVSGTYSGLSGLSVGSSYYITATAGAISSTLATSVSPYIVNVGLATATGSVLLNPKSVATIPYTFVYTSATGTWVKKDGLKYIDVEVQGPGGGGGGSTGTAQAGGGGGGGYAFKRIPAALLGSTENYTVASGGLAGGAGGNAGNASGSSAFGSHVSATSGAGGLTTGDSRGGLGGIGVNGDINSRGGSGGNAISTGVSGIGGSSHFGGGGAPVAGTTAGNAGGVYGGGGSGGSNNSSGGDGAQGLIKVTEFY